MKNKIKIGLIGAGTWGKNLARNFYNAKDATLYACCDLKVKNLNYIKSHYNNIKLLRNAKQLLSDKEIDAVAIATPSGTHFQLAKTALENNKDVFVEKPFTIDTAEAEELLKLSHKKTKILMIGHLMVYHNAIQKIRDIIKRKELGDIYYIYSSRLNLGKVKKDENVLWSFGPHDISMILYLLGMFPKKVYAWGEKYIHKNIEDVVFMRLVFNNKVVAHTHLSWIDSNKTRRLTVVGSKKMLIFDDMSPQEKIKICDKREIVRKDEFNYGAPFNIYKGDISIPKLTIKEPLDAELQHFIDCVRKRSQPLTGPRSGLNVIKILTAADKSLKNNGLGINVII